MSDPIQIQIYGHAHPTGLPLLFADSDVDAWEEALRYVVEHYCTHSVSFLLFGRGCCVSFSNGIPDKDDVERLCLHLTQHRTDPQPVPTTRLAA